MGMVKSQRRGRLLAVEKMELGDVWSDQNIFDLIVMQIGHPLGLLVARATCKSLLLNSHKVRAPHPPAQRPFFTTSPVEASPSTVCGSVPSDLILTLWLQKPLVCSSDAHQFQTSSKP